MKITIWRDFPTYQEYMQSDRWKVQRAKAFDRDGQACIVCGAKKHLEGHHINYDLMGTDYDYLEVITVCHDCHMRIEDQKKRKSFYTASASLEEKTKSKIEEETAAIRSIEFHLRSIESHLDRDPRAIYRPVDEEKFIDQHVIRINEQIKHITPDQFERFMAVRERIKKGEYEIN